MDLGEGDHTPTATAAAAGPNAEAPDATASAADKDAARHPFLEPLPTDVELCTRLVQSCIKPTEKVMSCQGTERF